jgi:predicted  nucleic acid-binding Zn-ribbon protein
MKSTAHTALMERISKIEQQIMEQNIALIDEELAELEAWKQSVKEHYLDVYDQRQQTLDFDIDELKYRKRQYKRKMDELEVRVKQKKKRIEDARHITMDEPLLLTAVVVLPGEAEHA